LRRGISGISRESEAHLHPLSPVNMAASETSTELPIRDGEQKAAAEQQIDPWDVQAGQDEQGNALAFDYVAISQYVQVPAFHGGPPTH